jgi:hypothetical protein
MLAARAGRSRKEGPAFAGPFRRARAVSCARTVSSCNLLSPARLDVLGEPKIRPAGQDSADFGVYWL